MQVYRGMDIGTAKPSADLCSKLPHHLIDICSPNEQYDVGRFVRDAEAAAIGIVEHSKLPVLAGGTAYYVKHFLFGLPSAPQTDPAVRQRVAERHAQMGTAALYEELTRVDPATAERIGREDAYRVTRAIEVFEQTGRPLSSYLVPDHVRDGLDARMIGLDRPRDELYRRIERRVDAMLAAGLYGEIASLLDAGYTAEDPGLRAIGYREFFDESGRLRPADDPKVRELLLRNTRRYAKRQGTFFRSIPDVTWIDADDVATVRQTVDQFVRGA